MALSPITSELTWMSTEGGVTYYFNTVVDEQGNISVRNIRSPYGLISDSLTTIPDWVADDIQTARELTDFLQSQTSLESGTATFTGQTYQDVALGTALNNTNYRVVYSTSDGMYLTTSSKTTAGFRINAGVTYGTVPAPKDVDWTVFEKAAQVSATGGAVTFAQADNGSKAVVFGTTYDSDDYRVVLSPDGFYPVDVINKTRTGFTIRMGYVLAVAQTAVVGYDVIL